MDKGRSVKMFPLLFFIFHLSLSRPLEDWSSSTVSNTSLSLHSAAQLIWKDFLLLSHFLSFGYYTLIIYSYSSLWSLFLSPTQNAKLFLYLFLCLISNSMQTKLKIHKQLEYKNLFQFTDANTNLRWKIHLFLSRAFSYLATTNWLELQLNRHKRNNK